MRWISCVLLGLSLFVGIAAPRAFAEGWVEPDTSVDVESVWASPSLGYDGNTSTYASDTSNRAGYGGYLELDFNNAITCGRLRINADFGYNIVDSVQIDVFKDGSWSNVLDGSISDAAYSEITFTPGQVTKARFRYHYLSAGYYFWLYNISFYASPEFIIDPSVLTKNPTDVEQTTVGLHGKIVDDGGAPCETRFQYGIDTNYGTNTAWTSSFITDQTFGKIVTGLTNGQTYHYRVQARNSTGNIVNGADVSFTAAPPQIDSWVSPTGFSDPDDVWSDAENAFDDEDASYARSYHNIYANNWGSYLYLTHSALNSDWIRFKARQAGSIDAAEVSVLSGATWTVVYQGSFTDAEWMEVNFPQVQVSQARIRFHVANSNEGLYWQLYEFDFHTAGLPRAAGWVPPTSNQNPEGQWVNIPSAYDGNLGTYASDQSNRAGYGAYVYFGLDNPIHCGRVRVAADFGYGVVDSVQIDVRRGGVWTSVLDGTINDAQYTEVAFSPGDVDEARFRFHYTQAGYFFWCYEFAFYESPEIIVPPMLSTLNASSVSATSAILHGKILDDGGAPVQYRFEYGTDTTYGTDTAWTGSLQSGRIFGRAVSGLTNGLTYHFRVQAQNSEGTIVNGNDLTFTTAPASPNAWLPPTGFVNPTGWQDIPNAFDDELDTFARENHALYTDQWSDYIYYTTDSLSVAGIRFMAKADSYIDQAEVGLSSDGTNWTTVFSGSFNDQQWQTIGFGAVTASQFRIRFHVNTTAVGEYWQIYEFNYTGNAVLAGSNIQSIVVTPYPVVQPASPIIVNPSGIQQFTAAAFDGLGNAIAPPPTFDWTVSGGGTIDVTGRFTAAPISSAGPYVVSASSGGVSGTAVISRINAPPVITVNPTGQWDSLDGVNLGVTASDDGGDSNLIYVWSVVGSSPGGANFTSNNSNQAKNSKALLTQAGTYQFRITISDAQGLSTFADVTVDVPQRVTGAIASPSTVILNPNQMQTFIALPADQFGNPIPGDPLTSVFWSVSGGGQIDSNTGVFTASATAPVPNGPFTITGLVGELLATATIIRINKSPTVSNISPANGAFVSTTQPVVSASYFDQNGILTGSVHLKIDNAVVGATVSTTGVTYSPTLDLAEGTHTVDLHVASLDGLTTDRNWSFVIDSIAPTVSAFVPANGSFVGTSQPMITASISDLPGSGVDVQGIRATLDGQDITQQSVITAQSFAYPTLPLGDGNHVVTLSVPDLAGNIGYGTTAFTIQTQVPPAPAIEFTQQTAGQVVVSGHVPPGFNINGLVAIVTSSSPGTVADVQPQTTVQGDQFQATFDPLNGATNFNASLAFSYASNLTGPSTPTGKLNFTASPPGDPTNLLPTVPIVSVTISSESLTGDKTGTNNGEQVSFTKNTSVDVKVSANASIGTISTIIVYGGTNAVVQPWSSTGPMTVTLPFPVEGRFEITAVAIAGNAGQTTEGVSKPAVLVVDRTPPAVTFSNPTALVTAPYGYLILNGRSEGANQAIRGDAVLPRNVYSRDGMELKGDASDTLSDVSVMNADIYQTDAAPGDDATGFDYNVAEAANVPGLINQGALRDGIEVAITQAATAAQPHHVTFDKIGATADLADSVVYDTQTGQITSNKVYLLTVTATDKAGNQGVQNIWTKVLTQVPKGKVTAIGNHWNDDNTPTPPSVGGNGTMDAWACRSSPALYSPKRPSGHFFRPSPTSAASEPAPFYPLWDGVESVGDYAKKVNLPPTKTLDLGNGVKLDWC